MKRLSLGSFRGLGLRPRPQKEPRPQSCQSRYLRKNLKLHLEKFSKHFDRTIREGKDHSSFFITILTNVWRWLGLACVFASEINLLLLASSPLLFSKLETPARAFVWFSSTTFLGGILDGIDNKLNFW